MGQKKSGEEFHMNDVMVKRLLKENNIPIKKVEETNISRFFVDEYFFEKEKITEDSSYVLGLLAADGCVSSKENRIMIELMAEDYQVLEDINKKIKNERAVKIYERKDGRKCCKIYFYSKKIKKDLAIYDIKPRKTYDKESNFLKNIPKEFFSSFLRGFFDGDGCITYTNGSIRWQLDGASKQTFLMVQRTLKDFYNIETKIRIEPDKKSTIEKYRLYCYGFGNCEKIFNLMYSEPNILKLDRKFDKYKKLLGRYKPHETSHPKE